MTFEMEDSPDVDYTMKEQKSYHRTILLRKIGLRWKIFIDGTTIKESADKQLLHL